MGAKHTPGPWVIGISADHTPHIGTARKFGPYGENVCVVARPGPAERMEGVPNCADANARLIAAAPEMLEALKEAARIFTDQGVSLGDHIDALIARIEGGE